MRNTQLEEKYINRVFLISGAGLVLGLIALAIGTELLILSFWSESLIKFWIWQGVWAIVCSIVISNLALIAQKGLTKQ
jgi:hypothetical protein